MVTTEHEGEASFAAGVLALLTDPARRAGVVAEARAHAATFDWAAIAAREMAFVTGR